MKKAPSDSPIWQLKKRELLVPLSFLITKPIKIDLSNLHYRHHYRLHYKPITEHKVAWLEKVCNIKDPITNPIKDPIKNNFS